MKKIIVSIMCILASAAILSTANAEIAGRASAQELRAALPSLERATGMKAKTLSTALTAYYCAGKLGYHDPRQILSVVDYTLPSTKRRLWVINLRTDRVVMHKLVAQAGNTGFIWARNFSNTHGSRESSIGVFRTANPYVGHDGYSLRIQGLDSGFNSAAESRDIVVHGADYVSEGFVHRNGYLGRSWGCLAVSKRTATPLINTIKNGTIIVSYYPDSRWLSESRFLHCGVTI